MSARSLVTDHFAQSIATTRTFFGAESGRVAECCRRMADRFKQGGTLLVIGEGAQATDAQHVAVEFVHPVIVGKRALPALAVTHGGDVAMLLRALARPVDILLGLATDAVSPLVLAALAAARAEGLFTILITGRTDGPSTTCADVVFRIDDGNPFIVQEVSETLYHVLWELVHVFFETDAAHVVSFLPPPGATRPGDLLADARVSTAAKAGEICALRDSVVRTYGQHIGDAGRTVAARVRKNGRLLAFGNGGSATDAQDAVVDCLVPPVRGWQSIPALSLISDVSVVSAVANDVGFDHVFARQVIAFGRANDVAIGFSTSGTSRNVLAAMHEARSRGIFTIGMSGGEGGELARSESVDVCVTAPSDYIPRIQEAHASAWHALLTVVQEELA